MDNPNLRGARSLAVLFNPVLYSGVGHLPCISQQTYLVGRSIQRVKETLSTRPDQGTIHCECLSLRVLEFTALRSSIQ